MDKLRLWFEKSHASTKTDPHRLDLHDTAIQLGKQMGVTFAINTDAHAPTGFPLLRYGLDEARRGWLSKEDVLNTRGIDGLRKWLSKGQ